jgi:radical SAM superfamily enzyme YgiQ (UPF0313 family)
MKVLLVYPRTPDTFWSFAHALSFVRKRAAFPPLGLLTVAAMLPPDWELRLVDMNVTDLSDEDLGWADYVFLSGMIVHKRSAHSVAARCAALSRTVIAGGPLFRTGYRDFPEIPHFVLGEAENVIGELAGDILQGDVKPLYQSPDWPDLRHSPVPRWDLIRMADYVAMPVQFSRGCPFTCEFCDIVIMNGRIPRTKPPAQVLRELAALRLAGWTDTVFIVDDNFIGNRKRAKELLLQIIAWHSRSGGGTSFMTQASVNLADHPALLRLMVEAGFRKVFLGIETPSVSGIEECGKTQNSERDLAASVRLLQAAGLEVMAGFIVGFDSDPTDIFTRQFEFIQRSGIVTAMVGLLTALPQTALHDRLAREGRLVSESAGNNTEAVINFVTRLDRDFIIRGYKDLMCRLYAPQNYARRVRALLRTLGRQAAGRAVAWGDLQPVWRSAWLLGLRNPGRGSFWSMCAWTLLSRPRHFAIMIELLILGHHYRRVASAL